MTTSLPGGGAKWVEFNPGEVLVYDRVSRDGKVWFLFGDKKRGYVDAGDIFNLLRDNVLKRVK